jgi:hypothetical protein
MEAGAHTGSNGRLRAAPTEACVRWAAQTVDDLQALFSALAFPTEKIDVGNRGAALVVRTAASSHAVILAGASEGPSRVIVVTGLLRNIDAASRLSALEAANDFNRTRTGGHCVVSGANEVMVTLQTAIIPAILTSTPPFARAFLEAFTGDVRLTRRYFRDRGISGLPLRVEAPADVTTLLATVDVETDVLLDFADLISDE